MLLEARLVGYPDGFPATLVDLDDGARILGHATSREALAALVRLIRLPLCARCGERPAVGIDGQPWWAPVAHRCVDCLTAEMAALRAGPAPVI